MAAASPVLINSSSPHSFRIPSITPPSLARSTKQPSTSSPQLQLPSPSTFVKRRPPGLEIDSCAQLGHEGAGLGFASVGSLWRVKKFEVDGHQHVEILAEAGHLTSDAAIKAHDKRTGGSRKLAKPKKGSQLEFDEAQLRSPFFETFQGCEAAHTTRSGGSERVWPNVYDVPADHNPRNFIRVEKSSPKLTENAFEIANERSNTHGSEVTSKAAKKSRKKTVKPVQTEGSSLKKPRKRKAKSEAIILNSDEPDPEVQLASALEQPNEINQGQRLQPSIAKPKLRKPAAKKAKATSPLPSRPQDAKLTNHGEAVVLSKREIDTSTATTHKSIYFATPAIPLHEPSGPAVVRSPAKFQRHEEDTAPPLPHSQDIQAIEAACRRRRSWTPARDTGITDLGISRPPTAGSEASNASHTPRLQLSDIFSRFGYAATETKQSEPRQRNTTGEAVTKKRRIESADAATANVSKSKPLKSGVLPKPTKRTKQPKKKARTITAMATAAFQPPKETEPEQGVASASFAVDKPPAPETGTRVEAGAANVATQHPAIEKAKKPRKPRKPRVKSSGVPDATSEKTKEKKPKKTKAVKFNKAGDRPKLFSPARATEQLRKQDFLFGTSSQLAPAESPDFIRQLQDAVQESESRHIGNPYQEACGSQPLSSAVNMSPQEKSCAKVPTAPHGTCLSIEQTEKQLWCIAARDFEGGIFRTEQGELKDEEGDPSQLNGLPDEVEAAASTRMDPEPLFSAEHSVLNLCTSPLVPPEVTCHATLTLEGEERPREVSDVDEDGHDLILAPSTCEEKEDHSWMIVRSDDSLPVLSRREPTLPPNAALNTKPTAPTSPGKFASPRVFRPILHPLDSNASFLHRTSSTKATAFNQARAISSTAADSSRNFKRPRGRPRKDANPVTSSASLLKEKERSPTLPVAASSPPRSKLKTKKQGTSASQPARQSEWLDIDEISDSDAPTTPSPPRRRASSSPPAIRPLTLSPSGSQSLRDEAPLASIGAAIKPDGPQWPSIKASLFPQITNAIKAVPRSTQTDNLSWWERILLYDPIVVEDLSSWLNEQGLRLGVYRKKDKANSRKRKDGAELEGSEVNVDWELHEDPLQPWMVQKWCEEKGVCCYLKDGSWRRQRGT